MKPTNKYIYWVNILPSGGCRILAGNCQYECFGWDTVWFVSERTCTLTRKDETGKIISQVNMNFVPVTLDKATGSTIEYSEKRIVLPQGKEKYIYTLAGCKDKGPQVEIKIGEEPPRAIVRQAWLADQENAG